MKTALVTGSAKGIGKAIILEFAKKGYNCVINYNTSFELANKLKEEVLALGAKAIAIKADVSNEEEVNNMFDIIEKEFGGVDILVNNAAIDLSNLYSLQTIDEFKRTLDINLIGAYIVSKKCYKHMMGNKWGRIINISSTNGIDTNYPTNIFYDASKAALNSLTKNLAIQFSPYVCVNAVAPGFIGTESELDGYTEEFLKEETEKILLKRYGEAYEVAKLVGFLSSDDASYITNEIIRIDGGIK